MAFHGSILTCIAESKEAVIETLKKDPYTVGEVWDWNKVCLISLLVGFTSADGCGVQVEIYSVC